MLVGFGVGACWWGVASGEANRLLRAGEKVFVLGWKGGSAWRVVLDCGRGRQPAEVLVLLLGWVARVMLHLMLI